MASLPSLSPSTNDFLDQIQRDTNGLSENDRENFHTQMSLSLGSALDEFEQIFEQVSTHPSTPTTAKTNGVTPI